MNFKDKVVIITGASSGIGEELAYQAARKGAKVVLSARRRKLLDAHVAKIKQAGGQALAVECDVMRRDQNDALVAQAVDAFGGVDMFIANAGISPAKGGLMENSEQDFRATMETNLMGCVYGTWAVVPEMKKRGGGVLVFVSSIIGKRAIPDNAAYCASKFALLGLAEALRLELRRQNIRVTSICPPGVDTDFYKNNDKGPRRSFNLHSVEKIGRLIVKACEAEKREALLTLDSKLLHYGNVFLPGVMDWAIAKNKGV